MSELRLRDAVSAVVIDPRDRVLLVRFEFSSWTGWATPGGGVDPGETELILHGPPTEPIDAGVWTMSTRHPLKRFVIGVRRSRPKALGRSFTPGGA